MVTAPGSNSAIESCRTDKRHIDLGREILCDECELSTESTQSGWFGDSDEAIRNVLEGGEELSLAAEVIRPQHPCALVPCKGSGVDALGSMRVTTAGKWQLCWSSRKSRRTCSACRWGICRTYIGQG